MKQEYLFVGDECRAAVEKYSYEAVRVEIYNISNSDCWIAAFYLDGENEKSANALSTVHEYIMSHFSPTVLSNGCSAYYNKALYPHFNEFERKLRKLLYFKSALSKDKKDSETIKDLESKDFGEIFTLLFSDSKFVENTRRSVNAKTWQFTKDEILATLQHISENTLWDKLIGENSVPLLRSDFVNVKDFRNDIMHAHSMSSSSFSSAMKLIKKINEQLDVEIGKIIVEKEKSPETQVGEDFNTATSVAIRDMDAAKQIKILQEQLLRIQTVNVDGLVPNFNEYNHIVSLLEGEQLKYHELAAIQQNMQETARINFKIPSAMSVLQKNAASIAKYNMPSPAVISLLQKNAASMAKFNMPPQSAVLELPRTLQAFKSEPEIEESARKSNDITGGKK